MRADVTIWVSKQSKSINDQLRPTHRMLIKPECKKTIDYSKAIKEHLLHVLTSVSVCDNIFYRIYHTEREREQNNSSLQPAAY